MNKSISNKEITPSGKFSLSGVIKCATPEERLIQLQGFYNSMDCREDTEINRLNLENWKNEMIEIVKDSPWLNETVILKYYGF